MSVAPPSRRKTAAGQAAHSRTAAAQRAASQRAATVAHSTRRSLVILALGLLGVAVVLAIRVATRNLPVSKLPDVLNDGVIFTVSILVGSLPFVVLGIVLSVVLQFWVPTRIWYRLVPSRPFPRRLVLSVLGMCFPVCECGNVPVARGLIQQGFKPAEAVTFMLAAPIVNPITILTTWQAFGWTDGLLVSRVIGGFVIANFVGWLMSRLVRDDKMLTSAFAAQCEVAPASEVSKGTRFRDAIEYTKGEFTSMMPALVGGSVLAGAVQTVVPRRILLTFGAHPVFSVLALMLLGFVVSLCSNVDAFFILAFSSTFLPGALVAFLVFGPMIDIKMVALLRTTFRGRTVALIATFAGLGALFLGLVVNQLVA